MAKPVIPTEGDDGSQGSIEAAAERLRKVPGLVTEKDLAIIRRAVVLHLATIADMDDETLESQGRALASICRLYVLHEHAQRKGQP